MALQPTRFLVQHCLEPGTAEVREFVTASFAAVANEVLTNGGVFMAIEVAGLALEAYQPDFQDWIEATTLADLMASRKLRVVRLPERESVPAVPLPQYVPPSRATAPPAEVVPEVPPATPHAASTESTSVTIDVQDVLLAIGSLPRSEVPSCRNVVEHLVRHAKPSLATMVQSSLRRCGFSDSWEPGEGPSGSVPVAHAENPEREGSLGVVSTAATNGESAEVPEDSFSVAHPVKITTFDLSLVLGLFRKERTMSSDKLFWKLRDSPEYQKNNTTARQKRALLLHVAVEQGLIRGEGLKGVFDVYDRYTIIDPSSYGDSTRQIANTIATSTVPHVVPYSPVTFGGRKEIKEITDSDIGFLKSLFERKKMLPLPELRGRLKEGPGGRFQARKRQRALISEAMNLGVLRSDAGKYDEHFYASYTLVESSSQAQGGVS